MVSAALGRLMRPGHGVYEIVMLARTMINIIATTPRRPPLQTAELTDQPLVVE